jgi:hypothetical protein
MKITEMPLAQSAALRADRDRRRIDIARIRNGRVGEAVARRVKRLGFVLENPAKDVEVVNQHVLEDAARTPDVLDGRCARIAARHGEHLGRADLARIDPRLQRGERRIEASLKADHAHHASGIDGPRARLRALHRQVGGLFAKNMLAGGRRTFDELGVRVGARADHARANRAVRERGIGLDGLRAVLAGERLGGLPVHVDDVLEPRAGLPGEVGCVNTADAARTEHRDIHRAASLISHRILPCLWILRRLVRACTPTR